MTVSFCFSTPQSIWERSRIVTLRVNGAERSFGVCTDFPGTDYWMNCAPLTEFHSQILKVSPYNVSGYYSDVTEAVFRNAVGSSDRTKQERHLRAIYQDLYDNGGKMIWGFQKDISAQRRGFQAERDQSIPWPATAVFTPGK